MDLKAKKVLVVGLGKSGLSRRFFCAGQRSAILPLVAFAGLALLVASIGFYEVISYSVIRRVHISIHPCGAVFFGEVLPESSGASGAMILSQVSQDFARIWDHVKTSRLTCRNEKLKSVSC
jgi:hypothetical protein